MENFLLSRLARGIEAACGARPASIQICILVAGSLYISTPTLAAAVTSCSQSAPVPGQSGSCTVAQGTAGNELVFVQTGSQGGTGQPGQNGATYNLTNNADLAAVDGNNAILALRLDGGRAGDGNGKNAGGLGGTISLINHGDLSFLTQTIGSGLNPSDNSQSIGTWDDRGVVYGMYAAGIGGAGGKGSGDLFASTQEQNGGAGGAGGYVPSLLNTGIIRIDTGMVFGGAAIFASGVGGDGGEQHSSAGGDQVGGRGGRGRGIAIDNQGALSIAADASALLWGIGVEQYGGNGGVEAADGGTAGDVVINNSAAITVTARNAAGRAFDGGVAGIYTYAEGGAGSRSDDNSDRGGVGGSTDQITLNSSNNIQVTAQGIVAPLTPATPSSLPTYNFRAQSGGIVAIAQGGRGGDSPSPSASGGEKAGAGGSMVNSREVDVTLSGAQIQTSGDYLTGVFAAMRGGDGGSGRAQADAGNGGAAAPVRVFTSGATMIQTDGLQAVGLSAMSIGGAGGYQDTDGDGVVDFFAPNAGNGGNAGAVQVIAGTDAYNATADGGQITTFGIGAHGIRAQSFGGAGGGTQASFVLAGVETDAGGGGNGGQADVIASADISTSGDYAMGVLVQSVGGGGGDGAGLVAPVAVAGDAAKGGSAGNVSAELYGNVVTEGTGSVGILAQSIGGGGGSAGSAIGVLAVGGAGGAGGSSGDVTVKLREQSSITTAGDFAFGVLSQSVGGGGGVGGAAFAADVVLPSVSIGGDSSQAGSAGNAVITNDPTARPINYPFSVTTTGDNAHALVAQSVGGGGGSGGNASAVDLGLGAFSSGGDAGRAGNGGVAEVTLDRFTLNTSGPHAAGIVAHSVGGGGGMGGIAGALSADLLLSYSAGVGGNGKAGGAGNRVEVDLSNGTIVTGLDVFSTDTGTGKANAQLVTDAYGINAQSIGGGGGTGGAGVGKAVTKTVPVPGLEVNFGTQIVISAGGGGGGGGGANNVDVNLSNVSITTHGDGSMGINAQSIGGGGGIAGSASAKGGVVGSIFQALKETAERIRSGAKNVGVVIGKVNELLSDGDLTAAAGQAYKPLPDEGLDPDSELPPDPEKTEQVFVTLDLDLAVGGSGGSGGNGSEVHVGLLDGSRVQTNDALAHGVFMQSIGGGGGMAASGNASKLNIGGGNNFSSVIGVGGTGGDGGNGGALYFQMDKASSIATQGDNAKGVEMQSVGGGGGASEGVSVGLAGAINDLGFSPSVTLQVGRSGTGGGNGGAVASLLLDGEIETKGADATAVAVQSIGGGGGAGGSFGASSPEGGIVRSFFEVLEDSEGFIDVTASVGGYGGAAGNGGQIGRLFDGNGVATSDGMRFTGLINTYGDFSNGILLQSIGGGGGTGGAGVGQLSLSIVPAFALGGTGGAAGNGGNIEYGFADGSIHTRGVGALGVFMQTIGGGGGIAGTASRVRCGRFSVGGGLESRDFIKEAREQQAQVEANRQPLGGDVPGSGSSEGSEGGGEEGESERDRCFNLPDLDADIAALGASGNGGTITARNDMPSALTVQTDGDFASALVAQSIGAGGGAGLSGDVKTIVEPDPAGTAGTEGEPTEDENVTQNLLQLGSDLKSSGNGGQVSITGHYELATAGRSALGMLAQSIGAGGGLISTVGIVDALIGAANATGNGAAVLVSATDSLVSTLGQGAYGVVAQSIGGGGGLVTGELGERNAEGAALSLSVGGSQDAKGNGGTVELAWLATAGGWGTQITTLGEHARALTAQSIGGGGGLFGGIDAGEFGPKVPLGVQLGGVGSNGVGGDVKVTPTGVISTQGAGADAIVAQSIGGGGGIIDLQIEGRIGNPGSWLIGGTSQGAGNGGNVSAVFSGSAGQTVDLLTQGDQAYGVLLQSIGGGGGLLDQLSPGSLGNVRLGGKSQGASGSVSAADYVHSLQTTGDDAHAFVAQSIGGGGGVVRGTGADELALGRTSTGLAQAGNVNVKLGGSVLSTAGDRSFGIVAQSIGGGGGIASAGEADGIKRVVLADISSRGDAGNVEVSWVQGVLSTEGVGAHGIVAQSIGGGGGIAGDVSFIDGIGANTFDSALAVGVLSGLGLGNNVTVMTASDVRVSGAGAFAVIAQSIGGGGGLGGSVDDAFAGKTSQDLGNSANQAGVVTVNQTTGTISATGVNGVGIFAQSVGDSPSIGRQRVSVDIAGQVAGGSGTDGAGLLVVGGGRDNRAVVEQGGSLSALSGTAIRYVGQTSDTNSALSVDNLGTISGDVIGLFRNGSAVLLPVQNASTTAILLAVPGPQAFASIAPTTAAALTLTNYSSGVLSNARRYDATVVNNGKLYVGALDSSSPLRIAGDFTQGGSGTLINHVDFVKGLAGGIAVGGRASLAGTLAVRAETIVRNRELTFVSADGGITGPFDRVASELFTFSQTLRDGRLNVAAVDSDFNQARFGLNRHQAQVARYLDGIFDSSDAAYGRLLAVSETLAGQANGARFGERLLELSPGALLADAAANFELSQRHLDDLFGCRDASSVALPNGGCIITRVVAQNLKQDSNRHGVGYDGSLYGVSVALNEMPINADTLASVEVGYDRSDFNDNRGYSSTKGDIAHLGAALTRHWERFSLTGALTGSYGWQDGKRDITFLDDYRQAKSDHQTASFGGRVRAAYEIPIGEQYVKPYVDLDVIHSRAQGFVEHGAGELDLKVDRSDETSVRVTPAVEWGIKRRVGLDLDVNTFIAGGVSASTIDGYGVTARFNDAQSSAGSFSSDIPVARVVGRVSAGIDLARSDRLSVGLRYDGAYGSGFDSHTGSVQLTVPF